MIKILAAAALVASLAAPAMAAELTDAQLDEVTAGYTRPASVLAGVPGVVSQVTSGTTSSSASVVIAE